jgi:hypothetical protein
MLKWIFVAAVAFIILIYIFVSMLGTKNKLSSYKSAKIEQIISSEDIPDSTNYTYSIWFYIDQWTSGEKIIFRRGLASSPNIKVSMGSNINTLSVSVLTNNSVATEKNYICTINNIPIQSWVNFAVSIRDRTIDTYIDGKLIRTCVAPYTLDMTGIATSDLIITPDGGFDGVTTNLQYFDHAKNPQEIFNIYKKGYSGNGIFNNIFGRYKVKVSIEDSSVIR